MARARLPSARGARRESPGRLLRRVRDFAWNVAGEATVTAKIADSAH